MDTPPAPNGVEPLPEFFHLPLQQYALRQVVEPERALTPSENKRWAEHILLSYILGRRSEPLADRTPRLLTPRLLEHLNAVEEPEENLPATRFTTLLCGQVSPFDRMADLSSKAGRRRFYLDFALLHNLSARLPPALFPDFIWRALNEENTALPKPVDATFPLSHALAHIWRKMLPQIPFRPEDAGLRAQFLPEFLRLHAALEMDMRLITPGLLKAAGGAMPSRGNNAPVHFISAPPPSAPAAPSLTLLPWNEPQSLPPYLTQRLEAALRAGNIPQAPVNVFACNPGCLADFMLRAGLGLFAGRKNIGWCRWETSRLPEGWRAGLGLLDEIWVANAEQQKLFAETTGKPAYALPLPINLAEPAAHVTRRGLEIADDAFLFLQVVDTHDSISRKNLMGALQAFHHAFPGNENTQLLIKMRGHAKLLAGREDGIWARFRRRAAQDARIRFLPEEFSDAEQSALLGLADAVVSLHRASACGNTLLEAALLGTPVIASNCGGALEYIPELLKTTVPVTLSSVVFDGGEALDREPGHRWHDPDLAAAAKAMRTAFARGRQAKEPAAEITAKFSPAACGAAMAARLREGA